MFSVNLVAFFELESVKLGLVDKNSKRIFKHTHVPMDAISYIRVYLTKDSNTRVKHVWLSCFLHRVSQKTDEKSTDS